MYYKVVTQKSFFADFAKSCKYTDVFNIPCGTVFEAPKFSKYIPLDPKILINENVFHFSEGVFDTMLWHAKLIHHFLPCQIYAVQPLTDVIKQKCSDGLGLYQCGANKIKILEKQDIKTMYDMAVEEYNINPNKYQNFQILVDWWKKYIPTCFLIHEYHR